MTERSYVTTMRNCRLTSRGGKMRKMLLPATIVTSAAVMALSVTTTAAFAQPTRSPTQNKIVVGPNQTQRPQPRPCIPAGGHRGNCAINPCLQINVGQRCIIPPPPHRCIYPAVWVDGRCIILRPPPPPPPPPHKCLYPAVWVDGRCIILRPPPPPPHKCPYPEVWINGRCTILRTPPVPVPVPKCRKNTCV